MLHCAFFRQGKYTRSARNISKDAKELFVVTELFNIAVNDFHEKKSSKSQAHGVTELVASGIVSPRNNLFFLKNRISR